MIICKLGFKVLKSTIFWLLFCFLFFIACGEGPPESRPIIEKKFRTTPPSRIYFKNIRSTAYQWEQDRESRTDYYLLRKIATQTKKPILYPVIADIWMEDQAQLILKSDQYPDLRPPVLVYWQSKQDSGMYRLDSIDPGDMYQLGSNIYTSLRLGHALSISFPGSERVTFLKDPSARTHFMVSMQDYLRLTEYY